MRKDFTRSETVESNARKSTMMLASSPVFHIGLHYFLSRKLNPNRNGYNPLLQIIRHFLRTFASWLVIYRASSDS